MSVSESGAKRVCIGMMSVVREGEHQFMRSRAGVVRRDVRGETAVCLASKPDASTANAPVKRRIEHDIAVALGKVDVERIGGRGRGVRHGRSPPLLLAP